MTDIINSILAAINSVPNDVWALTFGALGISALQQKIKHFFTIVHPGVLVFMTAVFSFAAAVVPAALGYLSASPEALGQHTAMFFTAMTISYRYIIQPATVRLNNIKAALAAEKAFKAAQKPVATQPAGAQLVADDPDKW